LRALGTQEMKDIIDEIDSRIKSPLFGYFIFSLIAINWDPIFYLIVDIGPVSERIKYFHDGTDSFSLFLYPFLVASAYSIGYPWLHYLFILLGTKPTELKNSLQAESEHKLLTKKQELEEARSEILRTAETELIERAKRDVELSEIDNEEIREKLQTEIEQLRKERDEMGSEVKQDLANKQPSISKEQEELVRLITSSGGSMKEADIINQSSYDKVKTEYYLEDMEDKKYVSKDYKQSPVSAYVYSLTTKSKKIMVEKGVAK
jgi:hypothetical protein